MSRIEWRARLDAWELLKAIYLNFPYVPADDPLKVEKLEATSLLSRAMHHCLPLIDAIAMGRVDARKMISNAAERLV